MCTYIYIYTYINGTFFSQVWSRPRHASTVAFSCTGYAHAILSDARSRYRVSLDHFRMFVVRITFSVRLSLGIRRSYPTTARTPNSRPSYLSRLS